jgi:mannonate dehydratase
VESYGLRLEAIENVPNSFYTRAAMLGLPGRDAEIDGVVATVENMGRAGIPVLGFHWMPASVWRTAVAPDGRGGAVVSAFGPGRGRPHGPGIRGAPGPPG